jgi:23S rRNA (uracil1939-C5)-methyltransferase
MTKADANPFEVNIEKLIYGGAGLARHEGRVVFVPFSAPGDQVLVQPVESKKNYIRAEIKKIVTPGSSRIEPLCCHFEKCGGCDWQHLEYSYQVEAKQQILNELIRHKLPEASNLDINMRACAQPFGYRSRTRLQAKGCGPNAMVGFYRSGSHIIEDVETCPLFVPTLNEALKALRHFKSKEEIDPSPQEIEIACSEEERAWAAQRMGVNHDRGISTLTGDEKNEAILHKKIGNYSYSVTASAFFQANDYVVRELVDHVMHCAQDTRNAAALDLFSGAGLFSLPLASLFRNVVAVESYRPSSKLCAAAAASAGLRHLQTICADVFDWMQSETVHRISQFDLVVLDPPRTGAAPQVLEHLCKWAPKTIIYVSCDPQTLARDLIQITSHNYRIDSIQGFDMFPQTYHFETVVRLKKA